MSAVTLEQDRTRHRFGFKGAGAPAWCARQGMPLPVVHNTHSPIDDGGLVARLGLTEFYVEHPELDAIERLRNALGRGVQTAEGGVYPVLRVDAGMVLGGQLAPDVLLQVCNVNFGALDPGARPLVMTGFAGVSVLVFPVRGAGGVEYRINCDPTFAPWLWRTLREIVDQSAEGEA